MKEHDFFKKGAFLQLKNSLWAVAWGEGKWQEKPSCYFSSSPQNSPFSPQTQKHLRSFKSPCRSEFNKELYFIKKHFQKAVPLFFYTSYQSPSYEEKAHWIYRLFLKTHKELFSYGFWNEKEGFLGRSPETFFHKKDRLLKTQALAGTSKLSLAHKLLSDKKERKEHEFVILDIKNKLKNLGVLRVSKTGLKKLPHLAHLETKIEVDLRKNLTLDEISKRLHPTAALGGVPLERVEPYLQKQSPKRNKWGAPFGVYVPESDEFFSLVALRNVRWEENITQIGAGCGVVKESLEEKEWEEIGMKKESVRHFFMEEE